MVVAVLPQLHEQTTTKNSTNHSNHSLKRAHIYQMFIQQWIAKGRSTDGFISCQLYPKTLAKSDENSQADV